MSVLWRTVNEPLVPLPVRPEGRYDVVVVGGGLVGLTAATELASRGRSVLVLEAHERIGDGTTGRSTGKLSLLQGTRWSTIARRHGQAAVQAYVDCSREGLEWIREVTAGDDAALEVRPAITWSDQPSSDASVREELEAGRALGLPVREATELPGGIRPTTTVALDEQVQCDPLALLDAILAAAERAGASVVTGERVRSVDREPGGGPEAARITTASGLEVRAGAVVVATGTSVLDRSGVFALTTPWRERVLAFHAPLADEGVAMLQRAGRPDRSVRDARGPDGRRVLVLAGHGSVVGRGSQAAGRDGLQEWTRSTFDVGDLVADWSAQDYMSVDELPIAGRTRLGSTSVHVVSGFGGWGLVAGVGTARRLAAAIAAGEDVPRVPPARLGTPANAASIGRVNAEVGVWLARGWATPFLHGSGRPAEGDGTVHRSVRGPVATSTVDGCTRSVSAVCPHLGGVVRWNAADRSWDCPLHGSRFDADGTVLEGPATRGLGGRDA